MGDRAALVYDSVPCLSQLYSAWMPEADVLQDRFPCFVRPYNYGFLLAGYPAELLPSPDPSAQSAVSLVNLDGRARKDQAFSNGISSEIKIFQNGVPYWEEVIRIGKQLGVLTLKELFMCDTAIKYCKQEGIKVLRRDEIRVLEGIRKKREQYIS